MNQSSQQTRLIWILGGALAVALIVIAFLAGRESKPSSPSASLSPSPAGELAPEVAPDLAPELGATEEPRIERQGRQVVITNDDAPPPDRPASPAAEDGSLAEVAAYFSKVDTIQAGPAGISADAFAQQIAGEAAQGKTEGFEKLQKDLDRMESELVALVPPPACRRFHQLTMSTVADTKMLMLDLRRVFTNGDVSGADQIAARATAAQGKAKEIQDERRSIEGRYGLRR